MASRAQGDPPSVLVVEDEFIIALDLSETVRDLGYRVEGPFVSKKTAFVAIDEELPDLAILDVFTQDGEVYPLADALTEAGVPIIFHSGHVSAREMQERYPDAQAVSKPCPPDQLIGMVQVALSDESITHH
jgi:DNA-binding NtrC family response regulator